MLESAPTLGVRFREAVEDLGIRGTAALGGYLELYAEKVVFQDPLQRLAGRDAFAQAVRKTIEHAQYVRWSVHTVGETDDQVSLTWTRYLLPRHGPEWVIEGATHARIQDGRILYQRDYWDLLGSLMGSVPAAGRLYRTVVGRFV